MRRKNLRHAVSRWWARLVVVVTSSSAAAAASSSSGSADAATVEGADLLRRVQSVYGQSRRAIRSVEYDYTVDLNGNVRKSHYARDGERYYMGGVWVLPDGNFSMPAECAWDGQRVHHRARMGQLNRSTDRTRFQFSSHVPEGMVNAFVTWALGFEDELLPNWRRQPQQKFRFLGGRVIDDEKHGSCVELDFSMEWKPGKLMTRHARRYAYAPVYWLTTLANGERGTEMLDASYATVESEGNELYYPVRLTTRAYVGRDTIGNISRCRVDDATLKINEPIPRAQFVLQPWLNEDVYDIEAGKLTEAKDSRWSPVGKVSFPWDGFVEAIERNKALRGIEQPGAVSALSPEARRPWTETWGGWLIAATGAALACVAFYVRRRKRPGSPARA